MTRSLRLAMILLTVAAAVVFFALPVFGRVTVLDPGKPIQVSDRKQLVVLTCWQPEEGLLWFCVNYKERG